MVIRIFDDVTPHAPTPEVVDCPDCEGTGETVTPLTAQQDHYGAWSGDRATCSSCVGTGVVLAEHATEVDCCTDNHGRPLTRWRGDRCSPEHEARCDDHLPRCEDCYGATGAFAHDDDPWDADLYYTGRTA